ncbi:MAG: TRAM domain-containing protein [Chloroflexota bacterium]
MIEKMTMSLTDMAHGGYAIGRNKQNQVVFVHGGIPGEKVEVELLPKKKKVRYGRILHVIKSSPERKKSPYPNIGPHGGFAYQHMEYRLQLRLKEAVVTDQLRRIGGIQKIRVPRCIGSPEEWGYEYDVTLSPTASGRFGFWSPADGRVLETDGYPSLAPMLRNAIESFDFELPDLRKLSIRMGSDKEVLIAFEIQDMEPPELLVDIPISAALVLPDRTAANLIGETHIIRQIEGHLFKLPAGCRFPSNLSIAPLLIDLLKAEYKKSGVNRAIVLYDDVGLLTAFLAPLSEEVITIDPNPDGIDAAAANLEETENVSLYQGFAEEALPSISVAEKTALILNDPPKGLNPELIESISQHRFKELIYISHDLATFARDTKALKKNGYWLSTVQPFDMLPQTFHITILGRFRHRK